MNSESSILLTNCSAGPKRDYEVGGLVVSVYTCGADILSGLEVMMLRRGYELVRGSWGKYGLGGHEGEGLWE